MTLRKDNGQRGLESPWSALKPIVRILASTLQNVAQRLARGETRSAIERCTAHACSGNHYAQAALAARWLFASRDARRIAHATTWAHRAHDAGCSNVCVWAPYGGACWIC